MPTSFTTPALVNSTSLGGTQSNPMVAALDNGGYVVAWSSFVNGQQDVFFQRHDANGAALGGPVQAGGSSATAEILHDIVVTADGRFTLAWGTGAGGTVVTRSFNGNTGAATSGEVATAGGTMGNAQLVAVGTNQYKLITATGSANLVLEQATFNTSGGTVAAKTTITTSAALPTGPVIAEAVNGAAGEQIMVLSSGQTVSTNGTVITSTLNPSSDIIKLSDGTYILAQGTSGASEEARLVALAGIGALNSGYDVTGQLSTATVQTLSGTTNPTTFDKSIVSLGDGRVMIFFVSDTGSAFVNGNDPDGLYSAVYNTQTGAFESQQNTLIRSIGQLSSTAESSGMQIDAERLADGRVILTYAVKNGLTDFDIYSTILDPRNAGVTMAGTAGADIFIGTNFASSPDTVSYAGVAGSAIKLDLLNAGLNTGAALGDTLSNIENITGTALADEIYGTAGANAFLGGAGADKLFGRDGSDTLNGEGDDDQIAGGGGDDTGTGGAGNDVLTGGAGSDTLDGGANDDRITGGAGDDVLLGGDGADSLSGGEGNDQIDGGTGADRIAGAAGEDVIAGGADNDILAGGAGDDAIDGGAGNDLINGGSGTNTLDGGAGTDTISYAGNQPSSLNGFFIDLDPAAADPLGGAGDSLDTDDLIANFENAIGSAGNDRIYGSNSVNVLNGGAGDDTLFGRGNNDVLTGGSGSDRFLYTAAAAENDKITDFTVGADDVLIQSSGFGNINAGNIAASFTANASATVALNGQPQFIFDNDGAGAGRLFFDADGNGAGGAVLVATITFATAGGLASFGAGDFAFL